jgi:PEP-CTERM motif
MNAFALDFANPTTGLPINLNNLDFTAFKNDSVSFDMGGGSVGEIDAVGDFGITKVSVPEPSTLLLMLGAFGSIWVATSLRGGRRAAVQR